MSIMATGPPLQTEPDRLLWWTQSIRPPGLYTGLSRPRMDMEHARRRLLGVDPLRDFSPGTAQGCLVGLGGGTQAWWAWVGSGFSHLLSEGLWYSPLPLGRTQSEWGSVVGLEEFTFGVQVPVHQALGEVVEQGGRISPEGS